MELVVPPGGFDTAPDELVILACQVWYLAPSLPVRSLVTRHPEAVQGRDVITLVACRNMWYSAMVEMSQLLRRAGARRVDVVAATDTRPSSTTLVTTLRWLLTGRRGPFLRFGRAGVGDDELARVAQVGQRIAEFAAVPAGRGTRHACPGCCGPRGRQGISSLGHGGQVCAQIRFCSAHRDPDWVRARFGGRHRRRPTPYRLRSARRRCALRGVGAQLRLRPDLLQSIRAQRGGGCTTVATIASQSVNLNLNLRNL